MPRSGPKPGRAIHRVRRWYALPLLIVTLLTLQIWARGVLPEWAHPKNTPWLPPMVICSAYGTGSLVRRTERRLRKKAEVAGWLLCPNWVYPLAGEAGKCPECGRAFTRRDLRDEWLAW